MCVCFFFCFAFENHFCVKTFGSLMNYGVSGKQKFDYDRETETNIKQTFPPKSIWLVSFFGHHRFFKQHISLWSQFVVFFLRCFAFSFLGNKSKNHNHSLHIYSKTLFRANCICTFYVITHFYHHTKLNTSISVFIFIDFSFEILFHFFPSEIFLFFFFSILLSHIKQSNCFRIKFQTDVFHILEGIFVLHQFYRRI